MAIAEVHQRGSEPAEGWSRAPRLTASDFAAMIWRERAVGLIAAAAALALGLAAAALQKETFTAETRLLVRIGSEYVYDPAVGAAGAGATPLLDEILNAEAKLLLSPEVARRAVERIGVNTLYPTLKVHAGGEERRIAKAAERFAEDLTAEAAPRTPVISLAFRHEDAQVAADALNAYVDAYLSYRRGVLAEPAAAAFDERGADVRDRLAEANAALAEFRKTHRVGDFDTALKTLADLEARLESERAEAEAEGAAAAAQIAALRTRIAREPAEIELYAESEAARQLVALEGERAQLIAKFEPTAPNVVEIDRRIAELRAFVASGPRPGLTRRGPNPVRQDLERQLYTLEAQARAIEERARTLDVQAEETAGRLRDLQALAPQYRDLVARQGMLETNAQSFDRRAEDARASAALSGLGAENIRVTERAAPPVEGDSLRLPILALTIVLAGLAAIGAALVRGFARDAFPTPEAAARALQAPVLAVAGPGLDPTEASAAKRTARS